MHVLGNDHAVLIKTMKMENRQITFKFNTSHLSIPTQKKLNGLKPHLGDQDNQRNEGALEISPTPTSRKKV